MKIIFFGTSEFAVSALRQLAKSNYEIVAVITQPDKPTGRKGVLTPPPVKTAALKLGLDIFQPTSLKDDKFFETFKLLNCDLCILAAYGKIILSRYLEIPQYGFVNIHPSLLPKYRGPSPIQTTIMNSNEKTGVTIMLMDEQVDHGPILASQEFSIFNFQFSNYKELENKLANLGASLLMKTLPKYLSLEVKPQEQDHSKATFTKMLTRKDGRIDWNQPAEKIYNQIRALNPEPGTWTTWKNKILNIKTAECVEVKLLHNKVGPRVIFKTANGNIAVQTKTDYLVLKTLQLEGRKEMSANAFINGSPDFVGSRLV